MRPPIFVLVIFLVPALVASTIYFCGCGAAQVAKPVVDLTALELGCEETAVNIVEAVMCRNSVRKTWAHANGIAVTDLPVPKGASDASLEH